MKRSRERILTTHAGSLARPDDLRGMLIARDEGRPYDEAAFAARVRLAVAEVVRQQVAVGIDVVNDGEESKRNFTTYARERLGGIEERPLQPGERVLAMIYGRDAAEFPEYFAGRGNLAEREAVCTGPLTHIGAEAVQADIANFKAALAGVLLKYARLVGRENVIAGTDCGLGPRVGHPKISWAKFEALVDGARLATRELWGR